LKTTLLWRTQWAVIFSVWIIVLVFSTVSSIFHVFISVVTEMHNSLSMWKKLSQSQLCYVLFGTSSLCSHTIAVGHNKSSYITASSPVGLISLKCHLILSLWQGTNWIGNEKIRHKHKTNIHKKSQKVLQQNEGSLPLVPYYTIWFDTCQFLFLSLPTNLKKEYTRTPATQTSHSSRHTYRHKWHKIWWHILQFHIL
jgi:hypothetical protein